MASISSGLAISSCIAWSSTSSCPTSDVSSGKLFSSGSVWEGVVIIEFGVGVLDGRSSLFSFEITKQYTVRNAVSRMAREIEEFAI